MIEGFKPKVLMLLLTNKCNLNCIYCYRSKKSFEDMPFELAEKTLIWISSLNRHFYIQLTGGEPTLKPELIEFIANFVYKKSLNASIGLQTNGIYMDKALIKIIKKYNINLGISIDGPPEIQELLRGNSEKVFTNLKVLERYNVPFKVTSIITSLNVNFLPKLLLLLSTFSNFEGIAFSFLIKKGEALKCPQLTLPQIDEFEKILVEFLNTLDLINTFRIKPVRFRELELFKLNKKIFLCPALNKNCLAICPDGEVYTCSQTAYDPEFFCGTVENINLSGFLFLQKLALQSFSCSDCKIEKHCPKDCLSRTYYNRGSQKALICSMYQILWKYLFSGGNN